MGTLTRRFVWVLTGVSLQEQALAMAADSSTLTNNPEPVINAVLAALEAQKSAFLTNWLLVALLISAVMIVGGMLIILAKIQTVKEQTDGMHSELIEATRKLALIEGEVKGRQEQKTADSVSGKGE